MLFDALEGRIVPTVFNLANGDVGSLFGLIFAADSNGSSDTINLAAGGTYAFSQSFDNVNGANATTAVTGDGGHSLTIDGHGATITTAPGVSGFRFFRVDGGTLILQNVNIVGGKVDTPTPGGALRLDSGSLSIINSTIANSSAGFGGGAIGVAGGTLQVVNSTISGNSAGSSVGNPSGGGGGVWIGGGSASFVNATVANNTDNAAGTSGGGIRIVAGALTLRNTIVAENSAPAGPNDISRTGGTLNSLNSLVQKAPAGTVQNASQTNLFNVDPALLPLGNYGGQLTQALPTGSAAIDAGSNSFAPGPADERGLPRVFGPRVDIGAYEFQPYATTTILTTNTLSGTVGRPITFTATVSGFGSGSVAPVGTVDFVIDGVLVAAVPLVGGVAQYAAALPLGVHLVQAVFVPTPTLLPFQASAGAIQQPVRKILGRRWGR